MKIETKIYGRRIIVDDFHMLTYAKAAEEIKLAEEKLKNQYLNQYDDFIFKVEYDSDGSVDLQTVGIREETEKEIKERLDRELYLKEKEHAKKMAQYEALKKELGL